MRPQKTFFYLIVALMISGIGVVMSSGYAAAGALSGASTAASVDGTMLMFVGEALDVVTVASRTPESPSSAPAVVQVIDQKAIQKYGYRTLADLLVAQPGIQISELGAGSHPTIRGVENGMLILYDGVPIPTNGRRSYYPLDNELNLSVVKQVEIIRGPGSVLWGADAFAGIVNIVPLKGKDVDDASVAVEVGTGGMVKGGARKGYRSPSGEWDALFSIYGMTEESANDTYLDLTTPAGKAHVGSSSYYEMIFDVTYGDAISLSGRFSDYSRPYTLSSDYYDNTLSWASEKEAPVNFLKFNASKKSGRSHWNLTAYYQDITYKEVVHGVLIPEDEGILVEKERLNVFYGELLWDRRLFEKGLLTTGISWRDNRVNGALVDGGFVPEFLLNDRSVQYIDQADYHYTIFSLFSQYRHPFSWGEFWAGIRLDENSLYDDPALSCSLGVNVPITGGWRMKSIFGTGYRTHYSLQIPDDDLITIGITEEDLQRDHVATLNLQAEWQGNQGTAFAATAFYSWLSNTVQYDPIAGASYPADHRFMGVELSLRRRFSATLEGYANLSHIISSGEEYRYSIVKNVSIRPGEPPSFNYENWTESYDTGAEWMASAGANWRFGSDMTFSLTGSWGSPLTYSYDEGTLTGEYDNPIMLDGVFRWVSPMGREGLTLSVGGCNLLDGTFRYPGYYGPVEGEPLKLYVQMTVVF